MKTLLTIDFDAFVPEDPLWDFGHSDTEFMTDIIWMHRYQLRHLIHTTGYERMFWQYNSELAKRVKTPIRLSESHLHAWTVAEECGCSRVVSVDAHHDCWEARQADRVHCDNWLRVWLQTRGAGRNSVWYQPEWSWNMFNTDMLPRRPMATLPGMLLTNDKEIVLHVCRSGAWVAPWLDDDFVRFVVEAVTRTGQPMQVVGDIDPMKPRWEQKDYDEAKKSCEEMAANRELLITSIKSGQFANFKVDRSVEKRQED